VAYAAGPKRCEMWRQPVDFEEGQGVSCSAFEAADEAGGGHARGAAESEESSLPWGALGWDSLLDWIATTTSTTTTTATSTTTTTTTTATSTTATTRTITATTTTATTATTATTTQECHTASPGDDCYENVHWVMKVGILKHRSWYEGLNESSNFEEVQAFLHSTVSKDSKCLLPPCVFQATYTEHPALLCFSIVQKDGYEVDIIRAQIERKGGIFSCDGQAVLSAATPWWIGEVYTIEFQNAAVGISKDGTAGNTLLFMHAWHSLKDNVDIEAYDWVVKVDPDAVLVASRLQRHLASLTGSRHYVRNCNLYPDQVDFPMMYGSLEILSRLAMRAYFDGEESCKRDLEWQDWGEDYFMGHCLDYLGVTPTDDFSVISDGVCAGADCMDPRPAAFHPFKSADSWVVCWNLAQEQEARGTPAPPRRISGATPVELPQEVPGALAPPRPPPLDVAAVGAEDFAAEGLVLPLGA